MDADTYLAITIKPARLSLTCNLPVRIGTVDYKLIGTYEHTHPMRVLALVRSMLLNGLVGPAICVFQQQADTIFNGLPDAQPTPVNVTSYGQIGVADGHHRLAAVAILDNMGLLKTPNIPVQFVPARQSDIIRMVTSEIGDRPLAPGEQPLGISDIEDCFRHAAQTIPPNLTVHFDVRFQDRSFNWIRLGQPDVVIARSDWLKEQYDLHKLSQIIAVRQFQPDQAGVALAELSSAVGHGASLLPGHTH